MLLGIYTSQRCGSNLCEGLLHRHGIRPFGEQFCFDQGGLIKGKHVKTKYPVTHLQNLINSCAPGNYSVRIMTSHFKHYDKEVAFEKMLSIGQCCDHIIILKRQFFFKYTSQQIASITGQWVSFGKGKGGVMGLGKKFSRLYKKPSKTKQKPYFDAKAYTRWKAGDDRRFEMFSEMFPAANYITYKGMLESDLDINYIIPDEWNVNLELNDSVELPIKQVKENKTGSEPWLLYENPEVAKEYYLQDE